MTSSSIRRISARIFIFVSLFSALAVPDLVAAAINVEAERGKAIDLVEQAQRINPNRWYEKTLKVLRSMTIIAQKQAYGTCFDYPNTGAFTDWGRVRTGNRDVYLCPKLQTERYRFAIPTTLIHEAVHVMGFYDECPPERIEISVQNDLGYEVVETSYPHCKIGLNYRITAENIDQVSRASRPAPSLRQFSQPIIRAPVFNFGRGL